MSEAQESQEEPRHPIQNHTITQGSEAVQGTIRGLIARFLGNTFSKSNKPRSVKVSLQNKVEKINTHEIEQSMRKIFLLSRHDDQDMSIYAESMRVLRCLLDLTRTSPKTQEECQTLIETAQAIQKEVMRFGARYESLIQHFENAPHPRVMAETIKSQLHKVFDLCNVLIKKISGLQPMLPKK